MTVKRSRSLGQSQG